MLHVDDVTKRYGALTAVREVTFQVGAGEVGGYLGPNGSGKSTTVKMVAGLLEPSEGTISCGGREIREDLLDHRRRLDLDQLRQWHEPIRRSDGPPGPEG